MRIRLAVPDSLVGPELVGPALESVTRVNQALLRAGLVPRFSTLLRRRAVRWKPEPRGHGEHFDSADAVTARGWGDCDDLSPYWAAELRESGADPSARVTIKRTGPGRWHAVVRRGDGSIDDPSAAAGMPHGIDGLGAGVRLAHDHPLRAGATVVDVAEWPGSGWLARADLPVSDYVTMAHYALASEPRTAIAEAALSGACHAVVNGLDDDAATLGAVASVAAGWPVPDAAQQWGAEVGSIFDAISKGLTSLVKLPGKAIETAVTTPLKAAQGLMSAVPALAQGVMSAVPALAQGAMSAVPALAQGAMSAVPALRSVLATGLPLAQQLLPMLAPGLGPAGLALPVLQTLLRGM